ncbi:pyrimidine-specific ribonucleoside hydrolase [Crossiella equi]|uniref:Pyrimidine-specific ribonucleoside hydrolase n=1 Tax=Crossiella equi TaxID=130796 RepID=A0ABS5AJY2_9PSEU|nr:nucleoside hydrolase [Crossiella equi]MBP2476885.1 pyrimidine-specific ribonucleoside hydrolase [Crossiella equi]
MSGPTPLILDTDPGIDDAFAFLFAARSPELSLRAVTTVFGNVGPELTSQNALRLLTMLDRTDVPVGVGAARPLVHAVPHRAEQWHGTDGLGGQSVLLPEASTRVDGRGAVALMADVLRAAETPVTIVAIGPLTNVALLLAAHPELHGRIGRVSVMGGGFSGGNTTASAEFNIWSDPEAAHRVLSGGEVPVSLVPIDLSLRCAVDGAWLAELAEAGGPARTLAAVAQHYRRTYLEYYGIDQVALHDVLAVLEAARPGMLVRTPLPVEVDCGHGPGRGATFANRLPGATGRPVDVLLDADVEEVSRFVLARLTAATH